MSTHAKTRRGLAAATSRRRGSTTGRRGTEPGSSRGSLAQKNHHRLEEHVFPDQAGGLGAAAAAPRCDLERRVHGAALLGAFSPCFHQPPPHIRFLFPMFLLYLCTPMFRLLRLKSSDELASPATAASEQEQTLRLFLQDIERSIVFAICMNPEATEFFRDHRRRLDDYLAAAKNLLQMLQYPAVVASGDLHSRAESLLVTAMCSLATGLCHLRIWKPDALKGYVGCTPASIWELARSSFGGGSSSSAASWMSTSRSTGGSSGGNFASFDGYFLSFGEERSVRSGQAPSVTASYIDPKSVSILNKIASFMIEVGYEQKLRESFDRHSQHLVRYIEILDIDNILGNHMEESTELLLKVWISTLRIIFGVLIEMRRQLNQNDCEIINSLKEDYFSAIAKSSVMKLLNYASMICIQVDPSHQPSCGDSLAAIKHDTSKMVNLVTIYQALEYARLEILDLFSGQTKDLILTEVERLTNRLSAVFLEQLIELNFLLRSQQLIISNTGAHRVTRHIMDLMLLLVQQKNTVHMMLNGNPDKLAQVVTQLVTSLKFLLEMNSQSLALQGQQQLFLLNNMNFILQQAYKYTDLALILGESWCSQRHGELDQLMASYLEASWTPVISSNSKPNNLVVPSIV
uniref:Exocyst subunit Exo70 family protein n=1 Tax=Leersia perrieri TaxID=77586 RepID=A0A0D9V176_9ORYZ